MIRRLRFTSCLVVLSCTMASFACLSSCSDSSGNVYFVEEIREDFAYLYETLQATTYDLFLNTTKADFDREYRRVYDSISEPMNDLQINRLFQPFVVLAGFSHCTIDFPGRAFRDWYKSGGKFFPFDITFAGEKVLVLINWSENKDISPGDEILAINNRSINDVLREIYMYVNGENIYAKRAMMEMRSIMDHYWYAFGEYQTGTIQLKKQDGRVVNLVVDGIDLNQYRQTAKSVERVDLIKEGREFRYIDSIAYLRPGRFVNLSADDVTEHKAFKSGEFLDFLKSAFTEIAERKTENLILDLRGNHGGDNSFSDPMIAYFADKPFQMASVFRMRTSQITKDFWKDLDIPSLSTLKNQIMTLENGSRFDAHIAVVEPRNDSLAFKGRVFVLIDRFSFSNAAVVASIIQDHGFGYLIGEETSYVPSSCAAVHTFKLPNTHLNVVYPKAYQIRPNGDPSMRGVIPDFEVSDDIFTERDEVLECALGLIRDQSSG